MPPYRIVIADDHSLIRQGIKSLIRTDPSLQITGEAGNGLELLELLETDAPDMVILDLTMPLLNGFDAIERISRPTPEWPCSCSACTAAASLSTAPSPPARTAM